MIRFDERVLQLYPGVKPLPRSGHCMVSDDANLYVIGGYIQYPDDLRAEPEIWKFNLLCRQWTKLEIRNPIYKLSASSAVCTVGNSIIIHGGTGTDFGRSIDNSLIGLNLNTLTYHLLTSRGKGDDVRNLPISTYGHTLTYVELDGVPFLYKVGGVKVSTYTMNVYRYSLRDQIWELVSHEGGTSLWIPEPRYKHDTILYNQKLYIISGRNGENIHPVAPAPVFDLRTHEWSRIAFTGSRPGPLCYQASVLVRDAVYIFGGTYGGVGINGQVYCLDLVTCTCSILSGQGVVAYFHRVIDVPVSGEIYCFGGNIRADPTVRSNELTRFRIVSDPLRLSESAWNAFVYRCASTASFVHRLRLLVAKFANDSNLIEAARRYSSPRAVAEVITLFQGQNNEKVTASGSSFRLCTSHLTTEPFCLQNPDVLGVTVRALMITLLVLFNVHPEGFREESVSDKLNAFLSNSGLSEVTECMNKVGQALPQEELGCILFKKGGTAMVQYCSEYVKPEFPNQYPRAYLCLRSCYEELFIAALFYYLGVPSEFIHRLPDGPVYFKFLDTLESSMYPLHFSEKTSNAP